MEWGQIIFNGAILGCIYLLAALGLTFTYSLSKFPNFAHAEFITFGGYIAYTVISQLSMDVYLAFLAALLGSAILGAISFLLLFNPLRIRGTKMVHLAITSIGLGYVLRHSMMHVWGGGTLFISILWPRIQLGPISTNLFWLSLVLATLAITIAMHFMLSKTKLGKSLRAASDNLDLALACGIDVDKVQLIAWFLGGGLAGVGGAFLAIGTTLVPILGFRLLLPAFAVTILGGIGSFYGVLLASYIVGLVQSFGVVIFTLLKLSVDYQMALAFIILILTLILRPRGLGELIRRFSRLA